MELSEVAIKELKHALITDKVIRDGELTDKEISELGFILLRLTSIVLRH